MKKKNNNLTSGMNDLMSTSIGGMAGLGAIGAIGNMPGMPKNNVAGLASTGVNLAQLGGITKIGLNIIPNTKNKKKKKY